MSDLEDSRLPSAHPSAAKAGREAEGRSPAQGWGPQR